MSKLNPAGQLSSIDVDVGYGPSGPGSTCNAPQVQCNGTSVGISGVGKNSLPYPTGIGPNGNAALFINNGIIGSHVLPISSPRNKDTINQFKLQGTWRDDKNDLAVIYGIQYVQDTQNRNELDDFANNDWQAYAGYGPASQQQRHPWRRPAAEPVHRLLRHAATSSTASAEQQACRPRFWSSIPIRC